VGTLGLSLVRFFVTGFAGLLVTLVRARMCWVLACVFCAGALGGAAEVLGRRRRVGRGRIVSAAVGLGIYITLRAGCVTGGPCRASVGGLVGATLGTAGVLVVIERVMRWLGSSNRSNGCMYRTEV
jgi:hypothetical protein